MPSVPGQEPLQTALQAPMPPGAPDTNPVTTDSLRTPVSDLIRLPAGTELNEKQAQELASNRPVRLIVVAGAIDCGKTTLLTSLYELFQAGPLKSKQFAGCETLPAFEKRCHLSRVESENEDEDTLRNPYDGPHPEYLHLKVQNGPEGLGHIDFLFTDVSGEMFEHARNSTDECKKLTFLRRASHILVFLDGEKVFAPKMRWGMVKDAKSLIQSCLDSHMLDASCFVTVVWAKCDFFEAAKDKDKEFVAGFVKQVENDFTATFSGRIPHFRFHRTAARPTRFPDLKLGFGVGELLDDWIANWPQGQKMEVEPSPDNGGGREIDRFAKRQATPDGGK